MPITTLLPIVLLILLLAPQISPVSDISLLNCPTAYFSKQVYEDQNSGFVEFGETLYSGYLSSSNQQSLYQIIMQGDVQALDQYVGTLQIPYIFVAVSFSLVMCMVISWCLFSRSCPPWQWTKRDPMLNPYTKKEMRYTLFWMVVFAISIFALSVLILLEIPSMKANMEKTKCSLYVALDVALEGDSDTEWAGFRSLKNKVGNISSLISSTNTQIGLYFTGDDFLKGDITLMKTKINQIYEENKNAQLVSPNPFTTATQTDAGFPVPLVDSVFIKTGLGPIVKQNTMTYQLETGIQVTQKLADQAYRIDQSSSLFQDSSQTIKSNFIAGINYISMYINQLQGFETYLNNFSEEYMTAKFSQFLYIIQISLAICLIGTLLILIGVFSTSTFHLLQCRKLVHIGWIIYIFAFLASVLLLYIFLGMGSMSYGFCQYFDRMLAGDTEILKMVRKQNSQNVLNRLQVCLFGDGDLLKNFEVDKQIKTIEQFFLNIKTYNEYTDQESQDYVNIDHSIEVIQKWIGIVQNYKLGIFDDSNPIQTNQDNPMYTIQQLNLYSHTGGGVPTCSNDRWVFDSINCTDPSQTIYTTSDQENGGLISADPQIICISFNEGYATSYDRRWTQQDFTKRYIQIRDSCSNAYNNIISFGMTLINFRDSRINLFQGIQDSLSELLSKNQDFNSLLAGFRSRVSQFSDSTANLKNLVISEGSGITYTTNCQSLGGKLKDVHTNYCRNFMSQVVKIGLYSVFLTILIALAIWASSLFAVRYSDIEKSERLNMPEQIESERDFSDEKQPSTDSD